MTDSTSQENVFKGDKFKFYPDIKNITLNEIAKIEKHFYENMLEYQNIDYSLADTVSTEKSNWLV